MTKDEFKQRWEADDNCGGITFDDVAKLSTASPDAALATIARRRAGKEKDGFPGNSTDSDTNR